MGAKRDVSLWRPTLRERLFAQLLLPGPARWESSRPTVSDPWSFYVCHPLGTSCVQEAAELWKQPPSVHTPPPTPSHRSTLSSLWRSGKEERGRAPYAVQPCWFSSFVFHKFRILYPKVFLLGIKNCSVQVLICLSFPRFRSSAHRLPSIPIPVHLPALNASVCTSTTRVSHSSEDSFFSKSGWPPVPPCETPVGARGTPAS